MFGRTGNCFAAVCVLCKRTGIPVSVIGIESRAIPRVGWFPADGPDQWSSGTLFPSSSKKTARAINAASGSRPIVVLANLSGFDGSPESPRNIQLEYGSEIGRAIVNFDGPIAFCVVSRYHGVASVVFSGAWNDNMEVLAVEGSFASVLGGAPGCCVALVIAISRLTRSGASNYSDELDLRTDMGKKPRGRSTRQLKLGVVRPCRSKC